jgi:predicted DNA-binding transcriptional regulator AlpA
MFETVEKAGLTMPEVALVLGVSRAVPYNWKKGKAPHKMLLPRVSKFEQMLKTMIKQNKLPLPDIGDEERKAKIQKLKSVLDKFVGE